MQLMCTCVCAILVIMSFQPHNMNIFVTDFTLDNVVTHVQGFLSGILMIFFEKLSDMDKSGLTCGSCAWLTCSIVCSTIFRDCRQELKL